MTSRFKPNRETNMRYRMKSRRAFWKARSGLGRDHSKAATRRPRRPKTCPAPIPRPRAGPYASRRGFAAPDALRLTAGWLAELRNERSEGSHTHPSRAHPRDVKREWISLVLIVVIVGTIAWLLTCSR